jgi:hypothetical protein
VIFAIYSHTIKFQWQWTEEKILMKNPSIREGRDVCQQDYRKNFHLLHRVGVQNVFKRGI